MLQILKKWLEPEDSEAPSKDLEAYFSSFRQNIIGSDFEHDFIGGRKKVLYADWAASGRLYQPIEDYISNTLGPYVANTHTETSLTGRLMTDAYHQAQTIIKSHVNASEDDRIIFAGFGMTAAINKFQRILGLRVCDRYLDQVKITEEDRPLVVITHMEHHSNQTSWQECLVDVEIVRRNPEGLPDQEHLKEILQKYESRKIKIGAFSGCSNVTGILTPYHEMAEIMHDHGGYCFVDFSASAAYVDMNMHPENPKQCLDAIYFSPHKFLGGPGTSGVVIFHKSLYKNRVPDHPGGGTVMWTNPWGEHRFYDDIEVREDGGTPGFLQAIKTSLSILLKEKMGTDNILEREKQLKKRLIEGLSQNSFIHILEPQQMNRLGFVSFYSRELHYNLIVKLLNDRFGVQTRGGCSCAGTYGHILLGVDKDHSDSITKKIDGGDLSEKPGWVRISIHPTMTNDEVDDIVHAVDQVITNYEVWSQDYVFNSSSGEFEHKEVKENYLSLKETIELV